MKRMARFRWIIPPKEEITLRLAFMSDEVGLFDQTLNFEVVGIRKHYQLFCRGKCQLPVISREPRFGINCNKHAGPVTWADLMYRVVFSHRKKTIRKNEIVQKSYILDEEKYVFGPLHCGKPREHYREGRFPENMETFNISNCGKMQARITFYFQKDQNFTTFMLEPPSMTLEPGASQVRNTHSDILRHSSYNYSSHWYHYLEFIKHALNPIWIM